MAAPCQVDFYVLQDGAQSADRLACRLALMAWEQGHTALLVAADAAKTQQRQPLPVKGHRCREIRHCHPNAGIPRRRMQRGWRERRVSHSRRLLPFPRRGKVARQRRKGDAAPSTA